MKILDSLRRRAADRKAYAELLQLDDHLLRDIGVSRYEVRDLLAGGRGANRGIRGHE